MARAVQGEADDEALFDFVHTLYGNQSELGDGSAEGSLSALQSLTADADLDGCSVVAAVLCGRYRPLIETRRTEAVGERGF